jgi:acylphosphatase
MLRRVVHYSGRVQGVGFRYIAAKLAQGFQVTGYVQNLPDGRVHLVAEGEREELAEFLAAIDRQLGSNIHSRQVDEHPPTGEFGDFGVEY